MGDYVALEVVKGEVILMITLYTGTPGSGKSYSQALGIYYALKMGIPVVANFQVNLDVVKSKEELPFYYLPDDEMNPVNLARISNELRSEHGINKEGGIRLYIDECGIYFNARNWNDSQRKQWVQFFLQHRKLKYDVYLVTQFDTMLDKQIRSLVEYEVKHRKLNNVGWVGVLANVLCLGHPVFCAVTYWYPMKERLSASWSIGRRKIYRMYDTDVIFAGQAIPA